VLQREASSRCAARPALQALHALLHCAQGAAAASAAGGAIEALAAARWQPAALAEALAPPAAAGPGQAAAAALKGTLLDALVEALLLVSSLLAVVAVIWLRWRRPEVVRPFKVPLYPVPPLLFAAATSYMLIYLVQRRPQELMWGAVTLLAGWLIHVMVRAGEPDRASDEGGGK
jgi:hypothetical protein